MTVVPAGTVVGYVKAPWRSNPVPITTIRTMRGLFTAGSQLAFHVTIRRPTGSAVEKGEQFGTVSTNGISGEISAPLVADGSGSGPTATWRLFRF
jgi:hypothetical protein